MSSKESAKNQCVINSVQLLILSLQLSFAVIPLVMFTSNRRLMGEFVNPFWLKAAAWLVASIIVGLNSWLLLQTLF